MYGSKWLAFIFVGSARDKVQMTRQTEMDAVLLAVLVRTCSCKISKRTTKTFSTYFQHRNSDVNSRYHSEAAITE